MLNRIKTLASLYLELGLRWSAFRLAYAFRLRSGLTRLQTPQYNWDDRPLKHWLKPNIPSDSSAYAEWRKQNAPAFFKYRKIHFASRDINVAVQEADKLLNGELKYFSHEYHQIGFPPNWHQIPSTLSTPSLAKHPRGTAADDYAKRAAGDGGLSKKKHWSQISDDSDADIKFIWEPNRFAFVYTLVRAYAATRDEKYPQAFWQLIQDWAEHNPPNTGANWKDGQEIALRLMAWTFGFYAFINSPSTTNLQISQFTTYIASQAERIHANIGYAISTRSNHTISEACGLWLVGLLFPELNHAEKYFKLGKRLLEEEAAKQIFPDGSYAMYSLNYHRFILHIYLYALQLDKLNQSLFSNHLISALSNSIHYLSRLIDPATGHMPVYGSNDGALVLPLNNCDFTDYRPLLQLGSVITTGKPMFEPGDWDEDVFWLCGEQTLIPDPSPTGRRESESLSPSGRRESESLSPFGGRESESPSPFGRGARGEGGTYILRNTHSRAILRCTDFTSRPSHADQLHMDLWMNGHNIAIDAGTYLYSGEGIWRNGLARTSVHNTVTVDDKDQMTLVSRFTWTNWAKGKVLKHTENLWQGEHDGYKPVRHKRTVMALAGDRWLVVDDLMADEPHHYALHWLLNDGKYGIEKLASRYGILFTPMTSKLVDSKIKIQVGLMEGEGRFSIVRADPNSTRGWRSRYYGHKEPAISLVLEANQTTVRFWTFFGYAGDVVEANGGTLRVDQCEINLDEAI
jgi:asparagine synthase (glutamine-hydrolysing)